MSQLHVNKCAQIKADSTNGRKQEAWNDNVMKHLPFHETSLSTKLTQMSNVQ